MKRILYVLLFYAVNTYSHPCFDVKFNMDECSYQNNNNLGVCVKNNTGETITQQEFNIWLFGHTESTGGFGSKVIFDEFLPGSYMTIQTSNKRLKKGDQGDHNLLATIAFYQETTHDEKSIYSCKFQWAYLSPPYVNPVILNLEKIDGDYECRYIL